jgi:hypothetical protein
MSINIDISREVELIIRENKDKEDGQKISSELPSVARDLNNTLKEFEHDLGVLENRMHSSGLDAEFKEIKHELREKLSSFLGY